MNASTSRAAASTWWDGEADTYQREHEGFLGAQRWVWGPEGWDEADLDLLQAWPGSLALELGCGAAAGSRWLRSEGVRSVGLDLSHRMLQHSRRLDQESGVSVPVVQAHAGALPFGDATFDVVATAYGALPFVADADRVLAEVQRVLVPGGRTVLAVTHPIRWAFPDDPGQSGLTAIRPYFDRTPYVETDHSGEVAYVEHHRTVGDWVELVVAAGLRLDRLVEPPWNPQNRSIWGGWSPLRGAVLPGTLIIAAHKPAEHPAG
ncbi:MAG: class I SAM-dependent methyltransferase [Actinomycetia bacterium]|nr:class I SAM-dependent methyltransferase [Actinomycetes bacterium]